MILYKVQDKLPVEFQDFAPLFDRREAEKLLLYRLGIDHKIKLREGAVPPFKRPYPMS